MITFRWIRWGILGFLLLGSVISFSIGRSGDGKSVNSVDLGFEASVPQAYNQTRQYKDGTLSIFFMGFGSNLGVGEVSIRFHPLQAFYLELIGANREQAAEFLTKAGGAPVPMQDSCIQAYRIESNSLVYTVFQWSPTKGVVVMGQKNSMTKQSISQIEGSLRLLPGACGWN